MNPITIIIVTVLLIILNAFFVTSEFSLLRIRKTRLQKLFDSNAWGSDTLKKVMKDLNLYIISSQIGITLTTLGVGFVALPYFQQLFHGIWGDTTTVSILALLVAIFVVSYLHSVVGEIAPKIIAIQQVETLALRTSVPLYYFTMLIRPITAFYRKSAHGLLGLLRISTTSDVYSRVYSEDELKLLIAQSQESGEIDESEEFLINRVFDFSDTRVNEIFTPRFEISAFEISTKPHEIIEKAKETGYSRFPIYKEKLDQIEGFVHVKDLLIADHDDPEFTIDRVLRKVFIIHEAMRLDLLLKKMQTDRSQVAIVVDEYGSVEGLVTIEDLLESIVGPIDDEFDIGSVELVKKVNRNNFFVDGRVTLDVFNQAFQCDLESSDAVTVAGFILEHLETVPEEGSTLKHKGKNADYEFIVDKMDGNRVDRARVIIKRKKNPRP